MRGITAAILAGAAVLLIVGVFYLRSGTPPSESAPPAPAAPRAQPKAPPKDMERSARVEERLNELRNDFDHKQVGNAANPAPNRREVPTMPGKHREMPASDEEADSEDPDEMEQLKQTLLTNPDPEERIGAVLMLTGEEGPDSLHILLESMNDPDAEVRLAVVEALGDRSEELSPGVLGGAMNDSDAEVRFEAVSILGDMETAEAMQMVRSALNDPDEDVRALAEGILDFSDDEDEAGQPAATPHVQSRAQHK